jgi:hypothetical protein
MVWLWVDCSCRHVDDVVSSIALAFWTLEGLAEAGVKYLFQIVHI